MQEEWKRNKQFISAQTALKKVCMELAQKTHFNVKNIQNSLAHKNIQINMYHQYRSKSKPGPNKIT